MGDIFSETGAWPPTPILLIAALLLDALTGDPDWLYRRLPHPVVLMGRLTAWLERRLWRDGQGTRHRLLSGGFLGVICLAAAIAGGLLLEMLCARLPGGWLLQVVLVSVLLAGRGLFDHVLAVKRGLEISLDTGRDAVAKIVGRDPQALDEAGVARAAAESLAENFSDGVVAPAFWFLLLGLPGLLAYKMINTMDSMIGHRDERYEWFGKGPARLDDLVNWPAARLSGVLLALAAMLLPEADGNKAWTIMFRDAGKHKSINAGWPEAALAGALGIALAGPRVYDGETVNDAWMGDGRQDVTAADLGRALALYVAAHAVGVVSLLLLWLAWG